MPSGTANENKSYCTATSVIYSSDLSERVAVSFKNTKFGWITDIILSNYWFFYSPKIQKCSTGMLTENRVSILSLDK